MTRRPIRIDYLARVEGEGSLWIRFRADGPPDVRLRIFEAPRFFEALLVGRAYTEAPDITSRVCGICPVAYLMSSCHAMEDALGVRVDGPIRTLRRLLYCGEWIESHTLHIFFLHAPDFLGYPDAMAMAKDHPDVVRRGLRMKKAGNAIVALLGGRSIHPISVRVGGFTRAPSRADLLSLLPELEWGRRAARESLRWLADLPFPELEREYELVALHHPDEYPMNEGRLASSQGLDAPVRNFDEHFVESQVEGSNALVSRRRDGGAYLCGPLARFHLGFELLSPEALSAAREIGLTPPVKNPFRSLLVRTIEVLHAFDEAARIVETYVPPDPPFVPASPRPGTGYALTEAPRGSLFHRYTLDEQGIIRQAKLVPPTSQNLLSIEDDVRALAPRLRALPHPEATLLAERAVRNHDPCISCSTHFLTLQREEA